MTGYSQSTIIRQSTRIREGSSTGRTVHTRTSRRIKTAGVKLKHPLLVVVRTGRRRGFMLYCPLLLEPPAGPAWLLPAAYQRWFSSRPGYKKRAARELQRWFVHSERLSGKASCDIGHDVEVSRMYQHGSLAVRLRFLLRSVTRSSEEADFGPQTIMPTGTDVKSSSLYRSHLDMSRKLLYNPNMLKFSR